MNNYNVNVSLEAESDLKEIKAYITHELKNGESAKRLIIKLKDVILSLEEMTYRHNIVNDGRLAILGVRKILVDNYIIFYTVDESEKQVNIVRVLYNRRDWDNII